jgi:hypothetical protein
MNDEGDVFFSPRRKPQVKIAEKMTGKPFHIRVRDNGHDFEVYLDGKQVGARVCVPWTSRRSSHPSAPSSSLSTVDLAKEDIPRFQHSIIPLQGPRRAE